MDGWTETAPGQDALSVTTSSWDSHTTWIPHLKAFEGARYQTFGGHVIGLGSLELKGDTVIAFVSDEGTLVERIGEADPGVPNPKVSREPGCGRGGGEFAGVERLYEEEQKHFAEKYYPFVVTFSPKGKEHSEADERLHKWVKEKGFRHRHVDYEGDGNAVLVNGKYKVPRVTLNNWEMPDAWGRLHTDDERDSSPEESSGAEKK